MKRYWLLRPDVPGRFVLWVSRWRDLPHRMRELERRVADLERKLLDLERW